MAVTARRSAFWMVMVCPALANVPAMAYAQDAALAAAEPASEAQPAADAAAPAADGAPAPDESHEKTTPAVYADTIPLASAAPPVAQEPRRPADHIAEIVVTAQRRSEDVRAVPIAISVLSGDELRDAAVSNFDDMARYVPNVSFNSDFNSLYLRGIGTAEVNVIGEQAVVYMLDDVYVSRLDFLKPGFMDLQQIEVLKGPQGTLYGRNATGGVLKIDYGEPEHAWSSFVSLQAGQSDHREIEAALTGPITDDLAFRIAARKLDEDGHTLNMNDGSTLGDKHIKQARAKLSWDVTDDLNASIAPYFFDYFIGVWAGNEIFKYPGTAQGSTRAAIELLDPHFETKLDRRGSVNIQNRSDGKGAIVPLKFNWHRWGHTFTSITAYAQLNDTQGGDLDGNAAPLAELYADTQYHQWSQELRVVSPPGTIEYVGGIFGFKSSLFTTLDIPLAPNLGLETAAGVPALGPLLAQLSPLLSPLADPALDLAGLGASGDDLHGEFDIGTTSLGYFGQVTWHVTDTLTLLLGARYSSDKVKGHVLARDDGPLPIWDVLILGGYDERRKLVDHEFSPKVSLTWDMSDEITGYFTYAQGFRAGSFNVAAFSTDDLTFKPESSKTFETGIKTELFDGLVRFNLGGFFTHYYDYQLSAFNGFGYIISNAEKVETKGIESDLTAMLAPGLILNASVGYNRAKFIKQTHATCPTMALLDDGGIPPQGIAALPPKKICDLSGQPLFRAPRWTGSIRLAYQAPLFSTSMDYFVGADTNYKGGEYMDSDLDPVDYQDGYWLMNARLGIKDKDDRWRFEIHGKNLGDKLVKTFSSDVPLQAGAHWALTNPPRTFIAVLRLQFE